MIDIIIWSSDPVVFISNALSPSEVKYVAINETDHSALVVVPDDQLSLAIGKRGQNARLAVRLTGWKIDIKSVSEALELGLITVDDITVSVENSPVDSNFEEEFAQEMLEKTLDEDIDDTEEEIIEEEEAVPVKKVIEYEDFEDLDDEYSKYDEEIDYDEYDKYYDAD